MQTPFFRVVVEPDRELVRVVPHGELDVATVIQLEADVEALRARGFTAIVLDLRQLSFMDSTGLRLLLRLDAAARSEGFSFSIIDGEGPVRRLLQVAGLEHSFSHAA